MNRRTYIKHAVIPWEEKRLAYHREYSKNLTIEQRKKKSEAQKLWWKTDYGKYKSHQRRAVRCKKDFQISFDEWLAIWKDSNHYEERGPTGYVMCRFGDIGPYSKDNVYIAKASENKRDAWYNNKVCIPNTGQYYKDLV
jgi:hypothetical protein